MPDAASKTQLLQDARTKPPSSTERIWGEQVLAHGYTAIPSILIRAQARLGITPLQMNILVQLLDYWRDPSRRPFPTKKEIASRIKVTDKTIQTNIRQLEIAGLIRREQRKTAAGDWGSNIYHLDGLVDRVRKLEPDFAAARERRRKAKELAETPAGRRGR
ncbi:helix-turn-helix domain-containing protein [Roseomonas sp. JC162]|uniref:Helix-turn-helix domain-containing protein n=1 Tax=Neoroseomonas marina TaxID=1232220 RepID=A0A848EC59_9PROT|nr:helix-turn-helix domain-containing protein [Neoroseomonas marina]NMJ40875.1 helix-turn-helix domain-containing protein [Neoroseomonas marina]